VSKGGPTGFSNGGFSSQTAIFEGDLFFEVFVSLLLSIRKHKLGADLNDFITRPSAFDA